MALNANDVAEDGFVVVHPSFQAEPLCLATFPFLSWLPFLSYPGYVAKVRKPTCLMWARGGGTRPRWHCDPIAPGSALHKKRNTHFVFRILFFLPSNVLLIK